MRHIFSCIIIMAAMLGGFGSGFHASAQIGQSLNEEKAPVTWRAVARMTSADQGFIRFTATMNEGWHLYGMDMPADGPRATTFNIARVNGLSLLGKPKADREPLKKQDNMFNATLEYWEGKVVFTQKFKLSKKADAIKFIKCSVSYMGCNDQTCLPPATKEFTLKILPKK